jgi:hypothetical protein
MFASTGVMSGWTVIRPEPRAGLALRSKSRLIVTYRDRDVAFVWTLEHLSKTNWRRSSSVQIKPPQPKFLVFHSVLILSTLLVVKGYRIEFSV